MFNTLIMFMFISIVGGFTPPFPQEPRVGIADLVIPKYFNSCQACTITPPPPTYLDREFKWNIYIYSGIDHDSDCENHYNNVNLCPPTFEEIYSDPITFIITTSAYKRRQQPITCIKKVICRSL